MVLVKKDKTPVENRLDGKLTGEIEDMSAKGKLEVIRCAYEISVKQTINYEELRAELDGYVITLPEAASIVSLPEINEKYANAQSYHSRISTIHVMAINNLDAWGNLHKLVEAYILEKTSEYMLYPSVLEYPNTALQQAAVRNKLKKAHQFLTTVKINEAKAKAFMQTVVSKKEDLNAFITNLTRQVKVIALDRNLP
jgi:hypothetical protein